MPGARLTSLGLLLDFLCCAAAIIAHDCPGTAGFAAGASTIGAPPSVAVSAIAGDDAAIEATAIGYRSSFIGGNSAVEHPQLLPMSSRLSQYSRSYRLTAERSSQR